MTKFHINKKGLPAPCRAKDGNCPLGGSESHFKNLQDAEAYVNAQSAKKYGLLSDDDFEEVGVYRNGDISTSPDLNEQMKRMSEEMGGKYELIESIVANLDEDEVNEFNLDIMKRWDNHEYIETHLPPREQFEQLNRFLGEDVMLISMDTHFNESRMQEIVNDIEKERNENPTIPEEQFHKSSGIYESMEQGRLFTKMEALINHSDAETVLDEMYNHMSDDEIYNFNRDFVTMRDSESLLENDERDTFDNITSAFGAKEVLQELSVWHTPDKLQEYLEDIEDGV